MREYRRKAGEKNKTKKKREGKMNIYPYRDYVWVWIKNERKTKRLAFWVDVKYNR